MIAYEDLTPGHFVEWGLDIAPHPSRILGWACRRDDRLVAMGFVLVDETDRWWASLIKRDGFPPVGIHRHALSLFDAMDQAEVKEIFATADPAIPRSQEWLERLGFVRMDNEVWKRGISSPRSRMAV